MSGETLMLMLISLPLSESEIVETSLLESSEALSVASSESLVPSPTVTGSQTETPTPVQVLSPPRSTSGEMFKLMLIKAPAPLVAVVAAAVVAVLVAAAVEFELELSVLLLLLLPSSSWELWVPFTYFFVVLACETVMGSQAEMPTPRQEPSLLRSRSGEMFGLMSMRDRTVFVLKIGRLEVRPDSRARARRAEYGVGRCMVAGSIQ